MTSGRTSLTSRRHDGPRRQRRLHECRVARCHLAFFLPNAHYPAAKPISPLSRTRWADEYRTIVDAGLDLQVDCPDLALSRHMIFTDLSDAEFVKVAEANVEALNAALSGIDPARVRVHICWGNYEGPHVCDIDMIHVLPVLMKVRAQKILFETANPRHGHEWELFVIAHPKYLPTRSLFQG